jgi:hypothetical protein
MWSSGVQKTIWNSLYLGSAKKTNMLKISNFENVHHSLHEIHAFVIFSGPKIQRVLYTSRSHNYLVDQ